MAPKTQNIILDRCLLPVGLAIAAICAPCFASLRLLPTSSLSQTANGTDRAHVKYVISPGRGVGPLNLGDTRLRALELFPRKVGTDLDYRISNCGDRYEWVDLADKPVGNVS